MPEEQIVIVDRQDRIIAHKPRSQVGDTDIFRFSLVWIEDGRSNVLIHKRSEDKRMYPGLWQNAAGGFVSKGETYEQAALRELKEELGVVDTPVRYLDRNFVESDGPGRWAAWFELQLDMPIEGFVTKPEEVAELRWINKSELFDWRDRSPELFMPSSAHWRQLLN